MILPKREEYHCLGFTNGKLRNGRRSNTGKLSSRCGNLTFDVRSDAVCRVALALIALALFVRCMYFPSSLSLLEQAAQDRLPSPSFLRVVTVGSWF